jgi:hypothetical protein
MSELTVTNPIQFYLKEVAIVTKSGDKIDIQKIFDEINIFDSLFLPVVNGTMLITDAVGLSNKLSFDGSETLLLEITKDKDSDVATYKKAFRIYKQTDRANSNQSSESYILHFVSDELMFSDQQRVTQSYTGKYSDIVASIMFDYLQVPASQLGGILADSSGIKKVVIPNLRPLEAIEWCSKRSVDNFSSPNYVFFQNVSGYNFVGLSELLTMPEILDVRLQAKNIDGQDKFSELSGARSYEVVAQNDSMEKTRSGINAGKFIGFDPMTRIVQTRGISFLDVYTSMKHGNKMPNVSDMKNKAGQSNMEAFDSKKTLSMFGTGRKYSEYIKANDPESLTYIEPYEDLVFQRKSIFKNLMSKRLKFVMPGNFQLSSGYNVDVKIPELAIKEDGVESDDLSLNGKHLIVASRHIISFDKHETIIEVASTSTNREQVYASNPNQSAAVENY